MRINNCTFYIYMSELFGTEAPIHHFFHLSPAITSNYLTLFAYLPH